ncbi:MAG TPA: peptide-methionine (S)-S-oxide reductase MsrA [Candidatus Saccharimonadia bacterium]|nr:peptide-methionine (S)-S-oxide reductase MsrA [Candidatus Saccharimonadia bacterium]
MIEPLAHPSSTAVLGGGCFWCLEAAFQEIRGVTAVTSGYAGGTVPDPTYEQVCAGTTGHAEVVRVEFDPAELGYDDVLDIFWAIHDPTTPNRQGNDVGSQYRSMILTLTAEQQTQAEASRDRTQKLWDQPIVTEIRSLEAFYPAEAYHQNYFRNHPGQGYCQIVINPKLQRLRQKFRDRLRQP